MQSKKGWRALLAIGVVAAGLLPAVSATPSAGAAESKQSYIVVLKSSVGRASTVADEQRRSGDKVQHVYESALKGFSIEMTPESIRAQTFGQTGAA